MDSKHKGLPAFVTDLQDEAKYAKAFLSSFQQDGTAPPPTKENCKSSPSAAKEGSPTEDSSSDSSDTLDSEDPTADPDTSAPMTEEKAVTLLSGATSLVPQSTMEALMQHPSSALAPRPAVLAHHERSAEAKSKMVQLASTLVASEIPEDLLPLEETPPPPFPEHAKSCQKDQLSALLPGRALLPVLLPELLFIFFIFFSFQQWGVESNLAAPPPYIQCIQVVFSMLNKCFMKNTHLSPFSGN